jgi:AcrR family transcriptional regulator
VGDTAEGLVRAAEDAIRRMGLEDLRLREITSSAGANLAAVNYHFGGKTGLLYAVLERRLTPVHTERLRRLAELVERAGDRPPPVEGIVAALIDPLFDSLSELGDLAPMMAELALRLLAHPPERARRGGGVTLAGVLRQFDRALGRALPALDARERWRRLIFVTALLFHVVLLEPLMRELDDNFALGNEIETARESMKRFAVGGLTAQHPSRGGRRRKA